MDGGSIIEGEEENFSITAGVRHKIGRGGRYGLHIKNFQILVSPATTMRFSRLAKILALVFHTFITHSLMNSLAGFLPCFDFIAAPSFSPLPQRTNHRRVMPRLITRSAFQYYLRKLFPNRIVNLEHTYLIHALVSCNTIYFRRRC